MLSLFAAELKPAKKTKKAQKLPKVFVSATAGELIKVKEALMVAKVQAPQKKVA